MSVGLLDRAAEVFSVVVEVKGCWHREVREAMRTQLVERCLRENACRYGLYVVGWFSCPAWDPADGRRHTVPWSSMQEAVQELITQADQLSGTRDADLVRSYVLDCSLR